jgi:hypothetical protein
MVDKFFRGWLLRRRRRRRRLRRGRRRLLECLEPFVVFVGIML